MKRYSTNAIYEYIKENGLTEKFLFIDNKNWILIYGTESSEPRLILIGTEVTNGIDEDLNEFEKKSLELLSSFNIPIRILRFNESNFKDEVAISDSTNKEIFKIDTAELYPSLFSEYGISSDPNIESKPVNDATSSTFHDWQRNFLSGSIRVTDIDLIKFEDDEINWIAELKRSKIALNNWEPYRQDYPNYSLLRRAIPDHIKVFVFYNLYTASPKRVEDISNIRVFRIESDAPNFVKIYHEDDGEKTYDFTPKQLFG